MAYRESDESCPLSASGVVGESFFLQPENVSNSSTHIIAVWINSFLVIVFNKFKFINQKHYILEFYTNVFRACLNLYCNNCCNVFLSETRQILEK